MTRERIGLVVNINVILRLTWPQAFLGHRDCHCVKFSPAVTRLSRRALNGGRLAPHWCARSYRANSSANAIGKIIAYRIERLRDLSIKLNAAR